VIAHAPRRARQVRTHVEDERRDEQPQPEYGEEEAQRARQRATRRQRLGENDRDHAEADETQPDERVIDPEQLPEERGNLARCARRFTTFGISRPALIRPRCITPATCSSNVRLIRMTCPGPAKAGHHDYTAPITPSIGTMMLCTNGGGNNQNAGPAVNAALTAILASRGRDAASGPRRSLRAASLLLLAQGRLKAAPTYA